MNPITCDSKTLDNSTICKITTMSIKIQENVSFSFDSNNHVWFADPSKMSKIPSKMNFDDLIELTIENVGLTQIENNVFQNATQLKVLKIIQNNLHKLQKDSFKGAVNLKNLSLNENGISIIDAGAFNGLKSLEILDLRSNRLKSIPEFQTDVPSVIEKLFLNSNDIFNYTGSPFEKLNSLKILSLASNRIKSLTTKLFTGLGSLTELYLDSIDIEVIGGQVFQDLTSLTDLSLSNTLITSINETTDFQGLERLTKLNLGSNKHLQIDNETFVGLKSVESLNLSHNNFGTIDLNYFYPLKNLVELDLSDSKINQFNCTNNSSEYILMNLKSLSLLRNELEELNNFTFGCSPKLEKLVLEDNKLLDIRDNNLKYLKNLKELNLAFNSIKYIGRSALTELYELIHLNLSKNQMGYIDFKQISHLKKLEVLSLANNSLTNIHREGFKDLRKLIHLDLSANQLLACHPNLFDGKRDLKFLSLRSNELNFLEALLEKLDSLEYLDIGHNKFQFFDYDWIQFNTKLKVLRMDNNNLKKIKRRQDFQTLHHLEVLDLTENNCTNQKYDKTNVTDLIINASCEICKLDAIIEQKSIYKNASIILSSLVVILILILCWICILQNFQYTPTKLNYNPYHSTSFSKKYTDTGYYSPEESGYYGNSMEMDSNTTSNPGYTFVTRKVDSVKSLPVDSIDNDYDKHPTDTGTF